MSADYNEEAIAMAATEWEQPDAEQALDDFAALMVPILAGYATPAQWAAAAWALSVICARRRITRREGSI